MPQLLTQDEVAKQLSHPASVLLTTSVKMGEQQLYSERTRKAAHELARQGLGLYLGRGPTSVPVFRVGPRGRAVAAALEKMEHDPGDWEPPDFPDPSGPY